ncbi:MAG TPA: hypothetical protein VMW89_19640 [Desulfatiglandales bacterium]|nr:hypothetical protein [Desulfatiglandales bacterium]
MPKYSTETNKEILLNALGYEEQGSLYRDRIMMRLLELNLNPLIESIESAAVSSDRLGKKVFWLNIILGAATVAGFVIAVIGFFKLWPPQ